MAKNVSDFLLTKIRRVASDSSPCASLNKLAKPRLTVLEACHRLALSEGQKENRKKCGKDGDEKINKKFTAVFMIAIFGALTLSIGVQGVLAQENTVSGYDYSYTQGKPWFCQCNHGGTPGNSNDYETGLGLSPTYTVYDGHPVFDSCSWFWEDEAGGSLNGGTQNNNVWAQETPLFIWANVNGGRGNEGYDYSAATWKVPSPTPSPIYSCWLVYTSMSGNLNNVGSVEGETFAQFYQVNNVAIVQGLTCITQNTAQQPNGGGYEFLSAW